MTTQVPATKDEAMSDAHENAEASGQDIISKEDLVIRVVCHPRERCTAGKLRNFGLAAGRKRNSGIL